MDSVTSPEALMARRDKVLSPTYFYHYDVPVHVHHARGAVIWDQSGKRYLDCYNNVPSVGHAHPHVLEAMHRQAALINTHSRYLHESIITYAERLTATLPDALDMCAFVCTGTEANGLAYEIARTVTGKSGAIVTEEAYHGNALAVAALSPYRTAPDKRAEFVRTIPVPCQSGQPGSGQNAAALAEPTIRAHARSDHGLAMLLIDPIFDGPGIYTAPPGYLAELSRITRDEGGLVVMDEVQAGLTRLGDHMWGFMDSGIVPDIVTMGKPLGAGYPLAAVVARRDIFEAFAARRDYFNTFASSPVAGAAGNAVLDVIEAEGLLEHVHRVGQTISDGLAEIQGKFDCVGALRGKGLFQAVELVTGTEEARPDPALADRVVNQMRHEGVLISACGICDNVLKIRPPLVFSQDDAGQLLDTLRAVLAAQTGAT